MPYGFGGGSRSGTARPAVLTSQLGNTVAAGASRRWAMRAEDALMVPGRVQGRAARFRPLTWRAFPGWRPGQRRPGPWGRGAVRRDGPGRLPGRGLRAGP